MTTVVDDKVNQLKKMEGEMRDLFSGKQASLSQFNENTLVKTELEMLTNGEKVYKLVGPLLYPVELDDAKENVGKRLEFIEREVSGVEKKIGDKQKDMEELAQEIQKLQGQMQADAARAAAEAAQAGEA